MNQKAGPTISGNLTVKCPKCRKQIDMDLERTFSIPFTFECKNCNSDWLADSNFQK